MVRQGKFCIVFVLVLGLVSVGETDWMQFLGPNRNGTHTDDTFVKLWLRDGLKEGWRIRIGEGYSGIVVQNMFAATMDSDGKEEFVVGLDAGNGREKWRYRTGLSPRDVYGGLGPRVTPSIDRDLVITVSADGDLLALQAKDGSLVWKRSLVGELGWRPPAEGTACSPLVREERIYLIVGGTGGKAVAAFDRKTGKTLWTAGEDRPSYSSAVRWDLSDVPQVLFLTGANLFSLNANSGKVLWKYPWPTYDFVNVATPIVISPNQVFISSGYDQGAAMLRINKSADGTLSMEELWRNREMKNHFNNSVYHDQTIFGFDNAILKAIDASTGQTLWRQQGFGKGSLILPGSYLVILAENGELVCAKASRKGLSVERRLPVLEGRSWTPPSLGQGRLYLRNQNAAVCLVPANLSLQ